MMLLADHQPLTTAREKPIPSSLRQQGAPAPRLLRDAMNPLGRPGLTRSEQIKVDASNALSRFTIALLSAALSVQAIFTIEYPANSWMWLVLAHYVKIANNKCLQQAWDTMLEITFSNCAHGGERPKNTTLRSTSCAFLPLALPCPGNHYHKPYLLTKVATKWSFDTAAESEYPALLCLRFSKLLKTFLADHYHFEAPHQVLSGHKQHRKHQSLIPGNHRVVATEPQSGEYKKLPPLQHGELDGEGSDPEPGKQEETQAFGIYHTPSQFISRALLVQHPFDSRFSVEDVTRRNLFDMLTKGQSYVGKARLEFARMIAVLSKELACEESRFQASLPEHVQVVVKGKRILLYKHLLKHFGCPDLELAELMTGTDLVGVATKSPFFETKLVPASTTPEFALLSSRWQRKKLEAVDIHESDPELAKVLWETTLQEVDAGFLQGPFHDLQQVKSVLGVKDVVCSRRFAIMQSGKPRIIDDFKLSGVNKAYTSVDQLKLHDVDYLSSLCHLITSTIRRALDREDQLVRITLSDNSVLEAPLHNDFCGKLQWKGKCLDLSKAYKQMPISVQSRKFAVLIVHHFQTKKPVYFLSRSLPFGACSSVYSFNRVSRGIWYLASHGCKAMGAFTLMIFPS